MERSELYGHLTRSRESLRLATERLETVAAGREHPQLASAAVRLEEARLWIVRAAGGLSPWVRVVVATAPLAAGVAAAAWLARLVQAPAGGTIAAAAVAALVVAWPAEKLADAVSERTGRRRTKPAPGAARDLMPAGPPDLAAAEVVETLGTIRWTLSALMRRWAARHRFGRVADRADGFVWLRGHDRRLRALSIADWCVCDAVGSIHLWLDGMGEDG